MTLFGLITLTVTGYCVYRAFKGIYNDFGILHKLYMSFGITTLGLCAILLVVIITPDSFVKGKLEHHNIERLKYYKSEVRWTGKTAMTVSAHWKMWLVEGSVCEVRDKAKVNVVRKRFKSGEKIGVKIHNVFGAKFCSKVL